MFTAEIQRVVQLNLQREFTGQDEGNLECECEYVSTLIASEYPCIAGLFEPTALAKPASFADSAFLQQAIALLASARIYTALTSGAGGGVLTSLATADGTKEAYAPPQAGLAAEWTRTAMTTLGRVSCVSASYQAALSSFAMFGLAGRTRLRETRGCYSPLLGFGLGLLDLGAFPLLGYAGSDYFRNGGGNGFLFGETVQGY